MKGFSLQEILSHIDGKVVVWHGSESISKIVTKTSKLAPGCLLLIRRKIQNENKIISKLKEQNASGIIIKKPSEHLVKECSKLGIGIIEVKDNLKALFDCAAFHRSLCDIPFIQVIGSSGKTTTKEMIATVLSSDMPIMKTIKNYNAPSEVAKRILKVDDYHMGAVFEVGMRTGDMMKLSSSMVKPDIAVVTTIHRAHLLRLGTIDNIISAKAEMLPYLSSSGTLIINGEDENCKKFLEKYTGSNVLRFGFSDSCDIWASNIVYKGDQTCFTATTKDFEVECSINILGRYNVSNALAAILVGLKCGMELDDIVTGLSQFYPVKNRLEIINGMNGITIVNDNFNANPDSTKLLLDNVPEFAGSSSVVLVLGDMENPKNESRGYAKEVHFWIGQEAAKIDFQHMIAVGKWAKEYVNGALSKGVLKEKLHYYKDIKGARHHIGKFITPNSMVIFKSSPYVKIRRLISTIKG